jgi:hypothetical protein
VMTNMRSPSRRRRPSAHQHYALDPAASTPQH